MDKSGSVYLLLLLLVRTVTGQAPGDEDTFCTELLPSLNPPQNVFMDPPNVVPLMDSSHYMRLLPPNPNPVWQRVDLDDNNPPGQGTTWTEQGADCVSEVTACGYDQGAQNNWLITQHINTTLDNGDRLSRVTVQVDYTQNMCPIDGSGNTCQMVFDVRKFQTSSIDTTAARGSTSYVFVDRLTTHVAPGLQTELVNIDLDDSESGLYLAIIDPGTCIIINRLLVFYRVCLAETVNLVAYPRTLAGRAPLQVTAGCVENASPASGEITLTCLSDGTWVNSSSRCKCDSGFVPSGEQCVVCDPGFYASAALKTCVRCPNNSNSTQSGLSECPCDEGYYRTPQEVDLPCNMCAPGFYTGATNGNCLRCPNNSNSTQPGLSECSCNKGYYRTAQDVDLHCVLCERGSYVSMAIGACLQCPSNSNNTQSGLSECPCDEGYYRTPHEVDLPCNMCAPGFYTDSTNGNCLRCPNNSNNTQPGLSECSCNKGYYRTAQDVDLHCVLCERGFYVSMAIGTCLQCPSNSNNTQSGLSECPCDEGYYRTPQEVDLPCTQPPSPPRNVRVVNSTSTSVTLTWEEPLLIGGRSRDELRYSIWYRAAGGFSVLMYGTVNTTVGEIQGLVSGVVYQLFVSAETDITSQIPDSVLDDRGVAFVYPQPVPNDSPNTEFITGVTVSVIGIAIVAAIVITITGFTALGCYRRKVQMMEQQLKTAAELQANCSYGLVTKPPVTSPDTDVPQFQLNPSYGAANTGLSRNDGDNYAELNF